MLTKSPNRPFSSSSSLQAAEKIGSHVVSPSPPDATAPRTGIPRPACPLSVHRELPEGPSATAPPAALGPATTPAAVASESAQPPDELAQTPTHPPPLPPGESCFPLPLARSSDAPTCAHEANESPLGQGQWLRGGAGPEYGTHAAADDAPWRTPAPPATGATAETLAVGR